jgi:hypothetical protein
MEFEYWFADRYNWDADPVAEPQTILVVSHVFHGVIADNHDGLGPQLIECGFKGQRVRRRQFGQGLSG